jgi:hypothetical protein
MPPRKPRSTLSVTPPLSFRRAMPSRSRALTRLPGGLALTALFLEYHEGATQLPPSGLTSPGFVFKLLNPDRRL